MGQESSFTLDKRKERTLLEEWFQTVQYDKDYKGEIPELDPEEDDEGEIKDLALGMAYKAITPGGRVGDPSSRNISPRRNWVEKRGGMPRYMKFVRNALMRERGYSIERATAMAVNAMKRWARGGDNVRPQVRAAAAKAVAQWEAMKASSGGGRGRRRD